MSLLKRWRHLRNAGKDEGALRNVLMEVRDVIEPIGAFNKQSLRAVSEVERWAQEQTMVICKFLGRMNQYQIEHNESNSKFMSDYMHQYVNAWSDILAERTELHRLIHEHKKAEELIEHIKKRAKAAEKVEAKQRARADSASSPSRPAAPRSASSASTEKPPRPASPPATTKSTTGSPTPKAEGAAASPAASPDGISPAPASTGTSPSPTSPHRPRTNTVSLKKLLPKRGSSVAEFMISLEQASAIEAELASEVSEKMLEVQTDIHEKLRQGFLHLSTARMRWLKTGALVTEKALADLREFPRVTGVDDKHDFQLESFPELPLKGYEQHWFKGDELQMTLDIEREAARLALEHERKLKATAIDELKAQHVMYMNELTARLQDIERQHKDLVESLTVAAEQTEMSLQEQVQRLTLDNHKLTENVRTLKSTVIRLSLEESQKSIADAAAGVDQDVVSFALGRSKDALHSITALNASVEVANEDFVVKSAGLARSITAAVLSAVGTAQTVKQVERAQALLKLAKQTAQKADRFVAASSTELSHDPTVATVNVPQPQGTELEAALKPFVHFLESLDTGAELPQNVAEKVDAAMQFILDALQTIETLQTEQKAAPNNRQREVNLQTLDQSHNMMERAKSVIDGALTLKSSVASQKDNRSEAESQMLLRNWAEVLEQSIGAVIEFGPVWIECLRQCVQKKTKFEEFQVATRSIAAFSAQLVAFSRTATSSVADPQAVATKDQVEGGTARLIKTSHTLLEATREAQNHVLASVMLDDLDSLSETQASALVMNTQVEVLRLERALTREQDKLRRLRRLTYEDTRRRSVSSADATAMKPGAAAAAATTVTSVDESKETPAASPPAAAGRQAHKMKRQTSVSRV
eukprot:m.484363 g.484363  ORF g.484363 m.484363 type:complete len:874 (-) comp23332_c0_seq1:184-2805(-)